MRFLAAFRNFYLYGHWMKLNTQHGDLHSFPTSQLFVKECLEITGENLQLTVILYNCLYFLSDADVDVARRREHFGCPRPLIDGDAATSGGGSDKSHRNCFAVHTIRGIHEAIHVARCFHVHWRIWGDDEQRHETQVYTCFTLARRLPVDQTYYHLATLIHFTLLKYLAHYKSLAISV